jgi:hypothetical protein
MATKKQKEEPIEAEIVSEETIVEEKTYSKRKSGGIFWGFMLIVIGGLFLAQSYLGIDVWSNFWPILIIAIGLSLIIRSF